ncbi:MAG: c-type cytochrome [Candidatus Kryptoniota bacterium]
MEYSNQNPAQEKKSFFVRRVWLSPIYYVYFVSVLVALGMLYIHRENMVNRNSIRPDLAIDSTFFMPISGTPPAAPSSTLGPMVNVSSLLTPTKPQLENGEKLFKVNCASCHGLDGEGDGPAAASLHPKPRDYHATTGWVNGRLLSEMFKTVSEGVPASAMVSFAAALPASDRLDIIDYIRATFGNFPKDTPAQLEQMVKAYQLASPGGDSSGTKPGPISIEQAVQEIEKSGTPEAGQIENAAAYIGRDTTHDGAKIFNEVVIDRERALTVLAASKVWSKNESDFVTLVTADAVQNGFDPKVADLSAEDWNTIFDYLKDLFSKENIAEKNG